MNHPHSTFDAMSIDPIWLSFDAAESAKIDEFLADWHLRSGHRILEPGCGTGRLTERLVPLVAPGGTIVACETSGAMLEVARRRGLPAVEWRHVAAAELGEPAGAFDRILCFNVLPHLLPISEHLAHFARWLAPDGELWINHSASRAFINDIHRAAGLHDHLLPPVGELTALARAAGLDCRHAIETGDRYVACFGL
jgi:demethylmenaquinone methyltransferase/2-methoxy-6-polyprenyl-1,4-benzoquinol methylase